MSIIAEARQLYRQTAAHPGYAKSHIWRDGSENHSNLMRIINNCESPESVMQALEQTDMYAIRISTPEIFDLMMKWHRDAWERRNGRERLMDSTPEYITTPNLYKMLFYCREIIMAGIMPLRGQFKIVELGGGNGQFAFTAKKYMNPTTHVDIDIPETLYMAYVCTRHRFPEAKMLWVNSPDHIDVSGFDFVFVPTVYADCILRNEFDLFVNTASMGELPNDTIRHWMDFVQNKLSVRYFFGFNRFLNTMYTDLRDAFSQARMNENEASVLFDNRWKPLRWEVEPEFSRCPYEDTIIARYLLVILERTAEPETIPDGYLEETKLEDWWRLTRDSIGTFLSNQLSHDLTMTGTLFRLWNAIRIRPEDKRAVQMMIIYMKHLNHTNTMFEEELFYKKLL